MIVKCNNKKLFYLKIIEIFQSSIIFTKYLKHINRMLIGN